MDVYTIEEESSRSSLVVVFCTSNYSKNNIDWYAVDTNKGTCSKFEEISKEDFLPRLFGCAILNSSIYIVGGFNATDPISPRIQSFGGRPPTNRVLVFDTSSRGLKVAPSMICPRLSPLVVALGTGLYVFGGFHFSSPTPKPWAEYFNGHKWDKLPTDPPPQITLYNYHGHAIYGGDIIVFWNEFIFSSYCVTQATWNFFELPLNNYYGEFVCFGGNVAVVNHTMYWCFGDLFAFDSLNLRGFENNPLYTFDRDSPGVPSILSRLGSSFPHYVVPTGKKNLCLLWFDPVLNKNELKLSWINFQIRTKDSSVVPIGDRHVANVDGNHISAFLGVLKPNDDQGRRDINSPDISCECSYVDPQNLLVNLSKTMFVANYNTVEKFKKRNFVAATAEEKVFLIENRPMEIIPLKAKIEIQDLLQENELTEYGKIFEDEEIDVIALKHFTSEDFDTLKIPLVARNKLVHALRAVDLED